MKALVVDDSRAMRAILRKLLTEFGIDVTEAEHAKAALRILGDASTSAFDFALFDWNMPEMSGFELLKEVRTEKRFDAMSIMMVTTESSMDKIAQALDVGASEFLMKPFDRAALAEKLALLGFAVEA